MPKLHSNQDRKGVHNMSSYNKFNQHFIPLYARKITILPMNYIIVFFTLWLIIIQIFIRYGINVRIAK